MPTAEPRRHLDHLRPRLPQAELGVRGAVLDAERGDGAGSHVQGLSLVVARPDMGERDAEGRWLRDDAIGDRQRREPPARREPDDRDLRPGDELLHEREPVSRNRTRRIDRLRQSGPILDERQPLCPCLSGAFTTTRPVKEGGSSSLPTTHERGCGTPPPRVARADAACSSRRPRPLGEIGCGKSDMLRHARCDADRPVGSRRDHAVDAQRADQPLDRGLVFGREDAAPVGEAETGCSRITIDDCEPEPAVACCLEQTELRRPAA